MMVNKVEPRERPQGGCNELTPAPPPTTHTPKRKKPHKNTPCAWSKFLKICHILHKALFEDRRSVVSFIIWKKHFENRSYRGGGILDKYDGIYL